MDRHNRPGHFRTVSLLGDSLNEQPNSFDSKFEKRIRILFLGTFLAIGIYVTVATTLFIQLSLTRSEFIENHVKKMLLVKDLELAVGSIVGYGRTFILTNDHKFLEKIKERRDQSIRLIDNLTARAENLTEAALAASVESTMTEHIRKVAEATHLRTAGVSSQEIAAFYEEEVKPKREAISEALAEFAQYATQQYQAAEKEGRNIWRLSLALFSAAGVLSLLFFATLYWALKRALAEKRRAEESLALSEMVTHQAVDLTGVGIFNHDHSTNKIYWSPQMRHICGVGETEEVSLETALNLVPIEERATVKAAIQCSHDPKGNGVCEIEHSILRRDGTYRWVMVKSHTYFEKQKGRLVSVRTIGTMLDITKRKDVEISLRQALADLAWEKLKLERSNSELEEFASIAAHDLRAPITSMLGWVGILDTVAPKPRDEKIDKAIQFISANTKKADALIADLLEVARVNEASIQNEEIDLNKMLSDITVILSEPIIETRAQILCNSLPTVRGCPSHLESLFTNLIRNALTYRDKSRAPEILISHERKGDFYEFTVSDNGIGIEPQYTNRIFEMFSRLHPESEYPGTGIGLAYCKKVVELLGGRIWVDSKPGEGSSFHFTYPATKTSTKIDAKVLNKESAA